MSLRQYELMIILDPEVEERTVAPSLDKYLSVITTEGGSVDKVDIWGRRRLSFDIKKKSEGIYAVVNFSATPATAKELDRQLGLNEVVLRTKVLRILEVKAKVRRALEAKAAKAAKAAESAATTASEQPAAAEDAKDAS